MPGAGAFELACNAHLMEYAKTVEGKAKLGVRAFADALLVIPKGLAEQEELEQREREREALAEKRRQRMQEEIAKNNMKGGIDVLTGKAMLPSIEGVWDTYRVKRQFIQLSTVIASQLLLVDEVMSAGRNMGGNAPAAAEED